MLVLLKSVIGGVAEYVAHVAIVAHQKCKVGLKKLITQYILCTKNMYQIVFVQGFLVCYQFTRNTYARSHLLKKNIYISFDPCRSDLVHTLRQ